MTIGIKTMRVGLQQYSNVINAALGASVESSAVYAVHPEELKDNIISCFRENADLLLRDSQAEWTPEKFERTIAAVLDFTPGSVCALTAGLKSRGLLQMPKDDLCGNSNYFQLVANRLDCRSYDMLGGCIEFLFYLPLTLGHAAVEDSDDDADNPKTAPDPLTPEEWRALKKFYKYIRRFYGSGERYLARVDTILL